MFLERGPPGTKLGQELQELVRDILLVSMDLEECDLTKVNGLGLIAIDYSNDCQLFRFK
mgnify:CR=1 FL=1